MLLPVLGSSGSGDHCSTEMRVAEVTVGSKAYGHICDWSRWHSHADVFHVHLHLYILLSFSVNISVVTMFHVRFSSLRKP